MGNPTGTLENGGLLRVGWKSPRDTDINVNYLRPSALRVPERLQWAQVLTGRQNTGVVSSGFDTFIATVTVNDATHIHA